MLANLEMAPEGFGFKSVDGAYWSLGGLRPASVPHALVDDGLLCWIPWFGLGMLT